MRLFRRRSHDPHHSGNRAMVLSPPKKDEWPLDRVLIRWTPSDSLGYRSAMEHVLITGRTGSSKSTASGRTLAEAYLSQGWGGLVLAAKSTEREEWMAYAHRTGQLKDLIVFSPSEPCCFDPLAYEAARADGAGKGLTETLVGVFEDIVQVTERQSGSGHGQHDEAFWRRTLRQLLRNLIDLLVLANHPVSVPALRRALLSAASSIDDAQSESWRSRSFLWECLLAADARPKPSHERADLEVVGDYWMLEFPGLSERTRSIIVTSFTAAADALSRGLLRSLFGQGESNITPRAIEEGKIILVDLPVKEYGALGVIAAVLWKTAFMRHIERRDIRKSPRPCFLWMDEAQLFVTSGDTQFVSTCRSSRVSVVMLTQNLPGFTDALGGGDKGRAAADALFANLCTRIHHCNGCPVTNQWVSDSVGKRGRLFGQFSSPQRQDPVGEAFGLGDAPSPTFGFSEQLTPELDPSVFTLLKTGGPPDFTAEAIVVRTGRPFVSTGRSWAKLTFAQRAPVARQQRRGGVA